MPGLALRRPCHHHSRQTAAGLQRPPAEGETPPQLPGTSSPTFSLPHLSLLPQDEPVPLAFFVHDAEIVASLEKTLAGQSVETEKVLDIIYQPQAVFRVRAVTRCTSSLEGHTEAVISVAFSPTGKYEGLVVRGEIRARQQLPLSCAGDTVLSCSSSPRYLASGSGDTTVRFWDLSTETPQFTAKGGCWGVPGGQLVPPSLMDPLSAWGTSRAEPAAL